MTTLTDTQVITASGGLVELGASTYTGGTINISSSSAASPTNVISDTTVVCDGSPVEIEFFAPQVTTGASGNTYIALWKDGAEFVRYWGVMSSSSTTAPMRLMYRDTPTAGSHTYSVKGFYATAAGQVIANTGGTAQAPASLRVSKIVQATQWPAVTTGTIICTSSTRPASPFEGQTIYETDTDLSLTWSGSAWVQTGALSAWTSYTPTFTGYGGLTITQGNSSVEGKYTRVGRTIHFRARWFFGSTTSFSANGYFMGGLPVTAASSWNPGITAAILDSGSSHYVAMPMMADASTTTFAIGGTYTGGTYASQAAPTAMFVWNSGDAVYWGGTYEAAA